MLLACLLALLAAPGAPSGPRSAAAPAPARAPAQDDAEARGPAPEVLAQLGRWTRRFERQAGAEDHDPELRAILRDAEAAAAGPWRREVVAAVLDAYGAALRLAPPPNALPEELAPPPESIRLTRLRGREWLDRVLDGELLRWLAREVVALPRLHPLERRLAAVDRLGATHEREFVMALVVTARTAEPEVRRAAVEALVGWDDEAVHAFFVDRLDEEQLGAFGPDAALYERHFREAPVLGPGRAAARLKRHVQRGITSGDWREAARAIAVLPVLPDLVAVPLCLEALEVWERRGAEGHRSMRIRWDIAHELERRSGRSIGPYPDRWRTYWDAVSAGTIEAAVQVDGRAAGYSKAGFFGLRPETDRVTFVLDRSGSMKTPFGRAAISTVGTDPRPTRYEEAVEQMLAFLEAAGVDARFNVVLFDDGTDAWRRTLVPATPENLRAVRTWLLARRPDGGTQLRHGVERAMMLEPGGREIDLERLEADTIIVLCDGETAEGPAWVRPLLARTNPAARLVVHAVQVGGRGDGTLRALAAETGGRFVQVD